MILTIEEAAKKYEVHKTAIRQRIKSGSITSHKIYNKNSKLVTGVSELELNEIYNKPIYWFELVDFCHVNGLPSTAFYTYANLQKDSFVHMQKYKNKTYVSPKFAKRINAIYKADRLDIIVPTKE